MNPSDAALSQARRAYLPRPKGRFPGSLRLSADELKPWIETFFLGEDRRVREARSSALRAANENWPVLITGETGTGKDMMAHAIHAGSRRNGRPLQVVTVAGLRDTAWSVLFGHRRGSFTGATADHDGVFRQADGSGLLLQDVSDLPPDIQPMLLRVVEDGLFRPLGETGEVHVDVRILASTNAPLDREVAAGRFRADLYQRLSVLRIYLPPLREHLDDLEIYVPHFLRIAAGAEREPKVLDRRAMLQLYRYGWPGNVRELENFLYRVTVEVEGPEVREDDVRSLLGDGLAAGGPPTKDSLIAALSLCGGNKRAAARHLGVAPGTLYTLLRRYGIRK